MLGEISFQFKCFEFRLYVRLVLMVILDGNTFLYFLQKVKALNLFIMYFCYTHQFIIRLSSVRIKQLANYNFWDKIN